MTNKDNVTQQLDISCLDTIDVFDSASYKKKIDTIGVAILKTFTEYNLSIEESQLVLKQVKKTIKLALKWNQWGQPLTWESPASVDTH